MKYIELKYSDNIAFVWLNRQEKQNALNMDMFKELTNCFQLIDKQKNIRLVVLRGRGKSFCAGADLDWMKSSGKAGYRKNYAESLLMAKCFAAIYELSKPTITVVHGAVYGGALGLLGACDIVLAADDAQFAFSEVRLGLAPATIMPYVLSRIGEHRAKYLMLTGKRFSAVEALQYGMLEEVAEVSNIDKALQTLLDDLLSAQPAAQFECKALIHKLSHKKIDKKIQKETASVIANLKGSNESQKAIEAFFAKGKD